MSSLKEANGEAETGDERLGINVPLGAEEVLQKCQAQSQAWREMWEDCDVERLVRGQSYLLDHVKVKSEPPFGRLIHADLFEVPERIDHIVDFIHDMKIEGRNGLENGQNGDNDETVSRIAPVDVIETITAKAKESDSVAPMILVIHFQLPGNPQLSVVLYFALPSCFKEKVYGEDGQLLPESELNGGESEICEPGCEFVSLVDRFVNGGSDTFKDDRLKLIASCDGPWVVQYAVGSRPAIIGHNLTQRHFGGYGYREVDVDVGSSIIACGILGIVKEWASGLTVDLSFVLQGNDESELPERVLGGVRFKNVDLSCAEPLVLAPKDCEREDEEESFTE